MMKQSILLGLGVATLLAAPALATDRYQTRPPVIISADLSAPWVMQLGGSTVQPVVYPRPVAPQPRGLFQQRASRPLFGGRPVQTVANVRPNLPVIRSTLDPQYFPQMVDYQTKERPGTIVIDTNNRFLYLVMDGGKARRYGVGVGKPGFEWAGAHTITRKEEWPGWTPPSEMITREAAKGHYLPAHMEGGTGNPLGARAMYLGSTLYRIHGTNAPWTIGSAVSSGCIRLRNEDVSDLFDRVKVGTRVIVM
ncbi:L,D-transpeptidase [Rhizobium sp. HT1-10]|uniref:L,D-transpeptidase n=1 Tax=Rhizobium sp. HT1-10 TaxID=3111638 RepID=UPI003C26A191